MRVRPSLLLAAWLVAGPASAEGSRPAALSWTQGAGAEECLGGPELARAVDARLGRPALVALGAAEIVVAGRIERGADRWIIVVKVEDPSGKPLGTRELVKSTREAPGCRTLDQDIALVVALTIDPDAVARTTGTRSLPSAAPAPTTPTFILQPAPPASTAAPPASTAPPAPPAPTPAFRIAVDGGLVVANGSLPGTALGGRARLGARLRSPVWVEVGAAVLGERDARAPDSPPGARLGLSFASLAVCPELFGRPGFSALACGGLGLGAYQVTGFGVDEPKSDDRLYADASVSGRVRVRPIAPLHAFLGAGVHTPLVRDTFAFTDERGAPQRLFRAQAVATTLELGLGFTFPE